MEEYNIEASGDWAGKRIDKVLSGYFSDYSRSFIKKLFDDGYIQVNGKVSKPSYSVRTGDIFDISVPDPVSIDIEPENIPLDIIYEDDDVILVNKPKGMVVHPAPGHYSGTLVNGLMYHFKDSLSGINGEFRPGIVHRIDMDTTGVLVVCKNDNAHRSLSEQLHEHSITRKYYAIVHGNIAQDDGTVDAPIGRRWRSIPEMADMPSHITGFWSVLEESIPLLSVSLRPAGHIRSEFIWHPLDIPYLGMKFMDRRNVRLSCRDRRCMLVFSVLNIPQPGNTLSSRLICRNILKIL